MFKRKIGKRYLLVVYVLSRSDTKGNLLALVIPTLHVVVRPEEPDELIRVVLGPAYYMICIGFFQETH